MTAKETSPVSPSPDTLIKKAFVIERKFSGRVSASLYVLLVLHCWSKSILSDHKTDAFGFLS